MPRSLSPAQRRALDWLNKTGVANRRSILNAGFQVKTFEVLAERGFIKADRGIVPTAVPKVIYRVRKTL